MNEVKEKWNCGSMRSMKIISSSNTNQAVDNGEEDCSTWFDAESKADFSENTNETLAKDFGSENRIARLKFLVGLNNDTNVDSDDQNIKMNPDIDTTHSNPIAVEALYENKVEAALNTFEPKKQDTRFQSTCSMSLEYQPETNDQCDKEIKKQRRHSSSIEIAAMTSVKTGHDGIPVISFSFLQTEAKKLSKTDSDSSNIDKLDNQLYDFPKNRQSSGIASEVEEPVSRDTTNRMDLEIYDFPKSTKVISPGDSLDDKDYEEKRYDIPKSTNIISPGDSLDDKNHEKKRVNTEENTEEQFYEIPKSRSDPEEKNISSKSLEVGKSPGKILNHHQGSHSDSEDNIHDREKRRNQNRRLGKAWMKMRTWLREEKLKLGDVVHRHAKLQAVGAIQARKADENSPSGSRSGSYDLVEARAREMASITQVEEFGLSSVSEEVNASEPEETETTLYDLDSGKERECHHDDEKVEEKKLPDSGILRKKTASTENILTGMRTLKLTPVSFSLDELHDDVEADDGKTDTKELALEEREQKHVGKGGLIKRRMLGSIRGLMASTHLLHQHDTEETGPGGFEDVRRYVKQGGDFCKELAAILHERAELEASYAKGLSKLSSKLTKACTKDQGGNSSGGVNEAWRSVGEEMEAAAEAHRVWGIALDENLAKPLRVGVAEAQGRSRKTIETSVDKASKSLQEWRGITAKSKKQSFACARENERLQDLARIHSISQSQQNNNKTSNHHMTEKEVNKLESRRRKAEDSSRRADTEFYTVSVRAERARLEYEGTVRKGAKQMELLEEERLSALKDLANVYLAHLQALAPRLQQSADRLSNPLRNCCVSQDVEILKNLIRRMDGNESTNVDQLLPDFYAEHVTLAMNRERRKQALVRVLHLIRQDLERERRGREGLETLHRAFIQTPAFAADESTQNVSDKLHHMRSMLTYLEAAKFKVGGALAEIEGGKRGTHPLAEHILVSRDKQGLQQSVLKVPNWAKSDSFEFPEIEDDLDIHLSKDHDTERHDWVDRTAGDGNSENPPDEEDFSDFDEFSSQSEDNNNQDVDVGDLPEKIERTEKCRALYQYAANLNDELTLNPGDLITIHQKQADGWWIGECGGRTGIFPATYVQVIH